VWNYLLNCGVTEPGWENEAKKGQGTRRALPSLWFPSMGIE
jgi:hypothetical protein